MTISDDRVIQFIVEKLNESIIERHLYDPSSGEVQFVLEGGTSIIFRPRWEPGAAYLETIIRNSVHPDLVLAYLAMSGG